MSDFLYPQTEKYTFFCLKCNVCTWVEHVAVSEYDSSNIIDCKIIGLEESNVSDHLPIRIEFKITVPSELKSTFSCTLDCNRSNLSWRRPDPCKRYNDIFTDKLCGMNIVIASVTEDRGTAQRYADDNFCILNEHIHSATESGCLARKRAFKPKVYWCRQRSDLSKHKKSRGEALGF